MCVYQADGQVRRDDETAKTFQEGLPRCAVLTCSRKVKPVLALLESSVTKD